MLTTKLRARHVELEHGIVCSSYRQSFVDMVTLAAHFG